MTSLETKLNAILNDKLTNLKPENLKKGITCLGVTGTLEASASSGGIKQFSTIEEMNSSTGNTEGDLAVVYSSVLRNIQNGDIITTIIWPETVTFDTAITSRHMDRIESGDYVLSLMLSDTEAYIEYMSNDGSLSYDANYSSEDGLTYTNMDGEEVYTIPAMTISNANEYTCKFVKSNILSFGGLYKYSGTAWELAPTDLTTAADDVYLTKFYGKNGIETGTLQSKESLTKDEVRRRAGIWSNYNSGLVCPNDASSMFDSYTNLTAIPLLDTSSVVSMYKMFYDCTSLTTIPLLDTSNVTNMQYMFSHCKKLSDDSLNNILAMCTNATKITSNKTLDYIGLTSEQATKCTTLSNYSAFTAAGWTTGY